MSRFLYLEPTFVILGVAISAIEHSGGAMTRSPDQMIAARITDADYAGKLATTKGYFPWVIDVLVTLIYFGPFSGPDDYQRLLELSGLSDQGRDPARARERLHKLARARLISFDSLAVDQPIGITPRGRSVCPAEALAKARPSARRRLLTELLLDEPRYRCEGPNREVLTNLFTRLPQAGWTDIKEVLAYLREADAVGWLRAGHPKPPGGEPDRTRLRIRLLKRLDGTGVEA